MADRRPLNAFLKIERRYEIELTKVLRRTAADTQLEILRLEKRTNIGSKIRVEQLRVVRSITLRRLASLYREMGLGLVAARLDAAAAAADTLQTYMQEIYDARGISRVEQLAIKRDEEAKARAQIENVVNRMTHSALPLSGRVYKSQQLSQGIIDRYLNKALVQGLSAREIAAGVRSMILPTVPGGVSYAAMRLGRTELNNAFHASTISRASANSAVTGLLWNLSASHARQDECDNLEGEIFTPPGDAPDKPHPQCFCFLTPVLPPRAAYMSMILSQLDDDDG